MIIRVMRIIIFVKTFRKRCMMRTKRLWAVILVMSVTGSLQAHYDTCQVPVIFFYLTKKPPRQSLLRGGIIMFLNTFYQLLDVT